jgi:hypothetical protein
VAAGDLAGLVVAAILTAAEPVEAGRFSVS